MQPYRSRKDAGRVVTLGLGLLMTHFNITLKRLNVDRFLSHMTQLVSRTRNAANRGVDTRFDKNILCVRGNIWDILETELMQAVLPGFAFAIITIKLLIETLLL